MKHQVTFIKDDETDLTLRVEGSDYTSEDAFQLIEMMKEIVLLAEKTSVEDFAKMLNQADDIWL